MAERTFDKDYDDLLKGYEEEIDKAEENNAPKRLISEARKNLSSFRKAEKELSYAVKNNEIGVSDKEYKEITDKYSDDLKKNYGFFHRMNSLAKYLEQKVYNAFAVGSHENRKDVLDDDISFNQLLVARKQAKYDLKRADFDRVAERKLNKENVRRKARGLKPLEKTRENLDRFYTAHQERALHRISEKIDGCNRNIQKALREKERIESRINELEGRAQGYLKDFRGTGKTQQEIDDLIKADADKLADEKKQDLEQKEKVFAGIRKRTYESIRALKNRPAENDRKKPDKQKDKNIIKDKNTERNEMDIRQDTRPDDAAKNVEEKAVTATIKEPEVKPEKDAAVSRADAIKEMRGKLDEGKPFSENEKYITSLASMPPEIFDKVYAAFKDGRYTDVSAFKTSVICINDAPGEDFDRMYADAVKAQEHIRQSTTKVEHPERAEHKNPEQTQTAPVVIGHIDLSAFKEKGTDEMSIDELDKMLDKEKKKCKNLQRDLNRAKQALDRAEAKIAQNEDMISPKVQAEYDRAEKDFNDASERFETENTKFKDMKKERTARSRAKRQYLPEDLDRPMEPSDRAKAEKQRNEPEQDNRAR